MTISAMRGLPRYMLALPSTIDDDVAERRDVRAARRARAEEQAHLRHLPAHLHLVVEDAPGAAPPGEHLDLVGDARARASRRGRASARAGCAAVSWMRRIFSTVRRPHEPAFTVESLAMMRDGAPVDACPCR